MQGLLFRAVTLLLNCYYKLLVSLLLTVIQTDAQNYFPNAMIMKIAADNSYFGKSLYLQMKELFDSIAMQNAEIRTVANSLPLLLK